MEALKRTPGPLRATNCSPLGGEPCNQFRIENATDFVNTDGTASWDDFYVNFSGYFGSYGPHMFAVAPEMAALLPRLREIVAEEADDTFSLFEGDPEQSRMVAPYDALLREIDAVMAKITGGAA